MTDAPLILLVAHRLAFPRASGVGRYVRSLSTALATTTEPSAARYAIAASPEPDVVEWAPPSLAVHEIRGSRKLLNLRWVLGSRPLIERLVPGPTVVHALEAFAPIRSRLPRVWTVMDLMPITHPDWYPPRHRFLAGRALRLLRDSGDLVITISATVGQELEDFGVERSAIRVVHLAADDAFRQVPAPTELEDVCRRHDVTPGKFLLAVGGISYRKNLTTIAAALQRLPREHEGVELLVAGPERLGAEETLEALRVLGDRVRIAGYLPDREIAVLMHASRSLLHPSQDEGFGLVPVEAMAAGTAVLAARAGAVPEVVGDAAVLLPPKDVEAWAAAIARVRGDEAHRFDLVRAGAQRAAEFTWERVAAATRAVHLEALARRSIG